MRRRVHMVLEQGAIGDPVSILVDRLLMALILVNLIAVALELAPEIGLRYALAFELIKYFSLFRVYVEYALRMWSAVEHGMLRHLCRGARG